MSSTAQARLTAISRWVDDAEVNLGRDPEALSWHRVAKVGEEAGEVIAAMIGWTGGNPRKGKTHDRGDVMAELLDTALAALAAYEHLTGNAGVALERLEGKIGQVAVRAGLEEEAVPDLLRARVIETAHKAAPFHGIAENGAYSESERLQCAITALNYWESLSEELED